MTDQERATEIREKARELNKLMRSAAEDGLHIDADLHELNSPIGWRAPLLQIDRVSRVIR